MKSKRQPTVHFQVYTKADIARLRKAATLNKYKSTSAWVRAVVSGSLVMMGWTPLHTPKLERRKVCPKGHPYTPENTKWEKQRRPNGKVYKYQACRICRRKSKHRTYARYRPKKIAQARARYARRVQPKIDAGLIQRRPRRDDLTLP